MPKLIIFLFLILFFAGCSNNKKSSVSKKNTNLYAKGYSIENSSIVTKLSVFNPWEKANNISFEYFLINKNKQIPDSLRNKKIIRTPVKKVICLSTSHIGFLNELNETNSVSGISGSHYISNPEVRKRIESGEAVDVGYGQNLNYELILNQKPDLVLVYGIGSEVAGYVQKLEELGIQVIMIAEYLEETPLGKAEWLKFFGELFEKSELADSIFTKTAKNYLELKGLANQKNFKPKIMVGSPYNDSWWIPGGKSYFAHLIEDAGGDYLGKSNSSHESYVIAFEQAFSISNGADIWINMANLSSKKEILATDSRFINFKVFNEGKLYNNNNRLSEHGGNDFWESGTVFPDIILRDLIKVFYPELIKEEFVYYKEIK